MSVLCGDAARLSRLGGGCHSEFVTLAEEPRRTHLSSCRSPEPDRLITALVLLLEIRTGGLNQKWYESVATQLMSTTAFAPLAFRISIETLGHVLRTLELRG
jgi:hypothetical protein